MKCCCPVCNSRSPSRWGLSYPRFDRRRLLRWTPLPLAVAAAWLGLFRSLRHPDPGYAPYAWWVALFLLGFVGLVTGNWPCIVPYGVSFRASAATAASLGFLSAGTVLLPLTLAYTLHVYRTFRGKAAAGGERRHRVGASRQQREGHRDGSRRRCVPLNGSTLRCWRGACIDYVKPDRSEGRKRRDDFND